MAQSVLWTCGLRPRSRLTPLDDTSPEPRFVTLTLTFPNFPFLVARHLSFLRYAALPRILPACLSASLCSSLSCALLFRCRSLSASLLCAPLSHISQYKKQHGKPCARDKRTDGQRLTRSSFFGVHSVSFFTTAFSTSLPMYILQAESMHPWLLGCDKPHTTRQVHKTRRTP